jgi:hypothetical protein
MKTRTDPKNHLKFLLAAEDEVQRYSFYVTGDEFLRVYFTELYISPSKIQKLLNFIKKLPKFREYCYDIYYAQNLHKII